MGVQKSPLFRRPSTNGRFPASRQKNVNDTARGDMNSNWILLTFLTLYDLAQEYLTYKVKRIKITELVNSSFERFILNIVCYMRVDDSSTSKVANAGFIMLSHSFLYRFCRTVRNLAEIVIYTKQRFCLSY